MISLLLTWLGTVLFVLGVVWAIDIIETRRRR